jgi:ABC-type transport system substrate-binding protein
LTYNSGGALGLAAWKGFSIFNCVTPIFTFYAKCDIPDLYTKLMLETDAKEADKIEDDIAKILNDEVPFYTPWVRQTFNVASKKLGGTFALYANDRDSSMGVVGWEMATK